MNSLDIISSGRCGSSRQWTGSILVGTYHDRREAGRPLEFEFTNIGNQTPRSPGPQRHRAIYLTYSVDASCHVGKGSFLTRCHENMAKDKIAARTRTVPVNNLPQS